MRRVAPARQRDTMHVCANLHHANRVQMASIVWRDPVVLSCVCVTV